MARTLLLALILAIGAMPAWANYVINGCTIRVPTPPATACPGADLSYISLPNISFYSAFLPNVSLYGAYLPNTNFYSAYLFNADLTFAYFSNAYFSNADFTYADLTFANLTNAYLGNVELINARLINANLTNANLINADLSGADLSGANLSSVQSGGITGTPAALPAGWQLINGYLVEVALPLDGSYKGSTIKDRMGDATSLEYNVINPCPYGSYCLP